MNKLISYLKRKFDRKIFSKFLKKIDRLSLTSLDEEEETIFSGFIEMIINLRKTNSFLFIHQKQQEARQLFFLIVC